MRTPLIRTLAALTVLSAACAGCSSSGGKPSGNGAPAGGTTGGSHSSAAGAGGAAAGKAPAGGPTCTQLTPADVQPLMTAKARAPRVTKLGSAYAGEQCEFIADDQAVDVIVNAADDAYLGYAVAKGHADKPVAVSGVGDEAFRETDDFVPTAKKGNVMCSVTTASSVQIPGASTKLVANGYNHISQAQDDVLAKALGALCNRIFGSGNTTIDLSGL